MLDQKPRKTIDINDNKVFIDVNGIYAYILTMKLTFKLHWFSTHNCECNATDIKMLLDNFNGAQSL